ncbi:MAG: hypothetical protein QNJ68_13805 [Microcoleaceae cyanobacterium MO_207.B10]|nr:hypothetical protein [Microcoleaceae cyanobacterium MO_207.B10]
MNSKARILLIGTVLAISGIVIKGTGNANANLPENLSTQTNYTSISSELVRVDSIAQYGGSPWGQVASPTTYTNPDTGQELCFYSSSRWAPCPGQGDEIIRLRGGKCYGGFTTTDVLNSCPLTLCMRDKGRQGSEIHGKPNYNISNCNGLP